MIKMIGNNGWKWEININGRVVVAIGNVGTGSYNEYLVKAIAEGIDIRFGQPKPNILFNETCMVVFRTDNTVLIEKNNEKEIITYDYEKARQQMIADIKGQIFEMITPNAISMKKSNNENLYKDKQNKILKEEIEKL